MRLQLTLAYVGTNYAGWQLQSPDLHKTTIQGELEAIVARITRQTVRVHGSGRTDSGVHAEGQVAHLDLPEAFCGLDWQRALNASLPRDIRVLNARLVEPSFHARSSAKGKLYAYTLCCSRSMTPPRLHDFVWSVPDLNRERMHAAAKLLQGSYDFASFQNVGTDLNGPTVRNLSAITEEPGRAANLICPPEWPVSTWFFYGDGFLKQMVRNLMGLLVWVGRGKIEAEAIPDILAARDRTAMASPTAPAQGLTLMRVDY